MWLRVVSPPLQWRAFTFKFHNVFVNFKIFRAPWYLRATQNQSRYSKILLNSIWSSLNKSQNYLWIQELWTSSWSILVKSQELEYMHKMCECFSEEFRERFEKWSVEASMLDQTGSTGVHSSLETTPFLSLISVLHQQSNQSGNFLSVLKNLKLQFLGDT